MTHYFYFIREMNEDLAQRRSDTSPILISLRSWSKTLYNREFIVKNYFQDTGEINCQKHRIAREALAS
jgi:hypothetical protein